MYIRKRGSTARGDQFDEATVLAVWRKGAIAPGNDPRSIRKDGCGAWIRWGDYGKTVDCGWEIDHIVPVSSGGTDSLSNLQPLQWQNNRHKGDAYPNWTCAVAAAV
jgi:hypothetical protein